jgi:hypothetical protein
MWFPFLFFFVDDADFELAVKGVYASPAAQIEIPDAKIRVVCDTQGIGERGQEGQFHIIEYTRHDSDLSTILHNISFGFSVLYGFRTSRASRGRARLGPGGLTLVH